MNAEDASFSEKAIEINVAEEKKIIHASRSHAHTHAQPYPHIHRMLEIRWLQLVDHIGVIISFFCCDG